MELKARQVGVVLFPGFELLDVFGPLEAFGGEPDRFRQTLIAAQSGPVASAQGPSAVADFGWDNAPPIDVLLVPGGMGTRRGVNDPALLGAITKLAANAEFVTSVCTGSALLAKAGLLDGHRATSNKRSFKWVVEQGPAVEWIKVARWVEDGRFVTSSGVSAGIDMALAIVAKLLGPASAEAAAIRMEYEWHRDAAYDPFAKIHGLA